MSILSAYAKGLAQLSDPRTRGVVWFSLLLSIVVYIALAAGIGVVLDNVHITGSGAWDTVVSVFIGAGGVVLAWFLFPAVMSTFIGLFLDRVSEAVERRYYPGLPAARDTPILEIVGSSVRLLAVMLVLNLVALVFLIPPLTPSFPFVFAAVNGYLLGREYFEAVASRRLNAKSVSALRRAYRGDLFLAGLVIVFLLMVPLVNLLAPVIGTAAMVHIFESRSGGAGEGVA